LWPSQDRRQNPLKDMSLKVHAKGIDERKD